MNAKKSSNLNDYRLPFRRVITIESCGRCNHNAAYYVRQQALGQLVECTKCGYIQIRKD